MIIILLITTTTNNNKNDDNNDNDNNNNWPGRGPDERDLRKAPGGEERRPSRWRRARAGSARWGIAPANNNQYTYVGIYIYIYTHTVYIYIYICIYIYIYMCMCTYIYIYTHTHLRGEGSPRRDGRFDRRFMRVSAKQNLSELLGGFKGLGFRV